MEEGRNLNRLLQRMGIPGTCGTLRNYGALFIGWKELSSGLTRMTPTQKLPLCTSSTMPTERRDRERCTVTHTPGPVLTTLAIRDSHLSYVRPPNSIPKGQILTHRIQITCRVL